MPTVSELKAKISVDGAEKAKKELKELHGGSGSGGHGILDLASSFKAGLGAVTGFITGFEGFKLAGDAVGFVVGQVKDIIDQGASQQAVMAQTAQVIKSTGGAAHISAQQVGDLADRLARLTGVSDNDVQSVTNVLLTFTSLKKDVLPQATELVLDLSRAMHEDLNSASIQLGKALQDPVQGVTALRRVGVQLSDQQAKMVKHFVDVGDVGKAQAVIIKELTKEVGGSAEAYGKTFPGQMARFQVALDQAKEKIGLAILPILSDMLQKYVMPLADWVGQHLPAAINTLTQFLTTRLEPAIDAVVTSPFVQTMLNWTSSILDHVVPAVDSNKGLTGASGAAKGSLKNLQDQTGKTGKALNSPAPSGLSGNADAATKSVKGLTDAVDPKGSSDKTSHALVPAMRRADDELDKQTAKIPGWEGAIGGAASSWDSLSEHVHGATLSLAEFKDQAILRFKEMQPTMMGLLAGLTLELAKWGGGFGKSWAGVWDTLSAPVQAGLHSVETVVLLWEDLISGDMSKFRADWRAGWHNVENDVKQFVHGMDELRPIFKQVGEHFVQAMIGGVAALTPDLAQALRYAAYNAVNNLPAWMRGVLPKLGGGGGGKSGGGSVHSPHGFASGGITTGEPFEAAERGPELLMTPGLYNAPAGSRIYNAQQTAAMLSGHPINVNVYGSDYSSSMQIARDVRRQLSRELALHG